MGGGGIRGCCKLFKRSEGDVWWTPANLLPPTLRRSAPLTAVDEGSVGVLIIHDTTLGIRSVPTEDVGIWDPHPERLGSGTAVAAPAAAAAAATRDRLKQDELH